MATEYTPPEDGPKASFGLFKNSYKKQDSHPDYVAGITLTDTLLHQVLALRQQGKMASLGVAGWRKETRNGEPYVSCQVQVDTYKTAKRYGVEESDIRETIDSAAGKQKKKPSATPSSEQDDFLGASESVAVPAAQDPFADSPPPAEGATSDVDPFDSNADDLPF